jgi:hypothetical protein
MPRVNKKKGNHPLAKSPPYGKTSRKSRNVRKSARKMEVSSQHSTDQGNAAISAMQLDAWLVIFQKVASLKTLYRGVALTCKQLNALVRSITTCKEMVEYITEDDTDVLEYLVAGAKRGDVNIVGLILRTCPESKYAEGHCDGDFDDNESNKGNDPDDQEGDAYGEESEAEADGDSDNEGGGENDDTYADSDSDSDYYYDVDDDIQLHDNHALRRAFEEACRGGHFHIVKMIIDAPQSGAIPSRDVISFGHGYTLRWAARHGYTQVVRMLIEAGADVKVGYYYALRVAVSRGDNNLFNVLLQSNAFMNSYYANEWVSNRVLKMAIDSNKWEYAILLLVEAARMCGLRTVWMAVWNKELSINRFILLPIVSLIWGMNWVYEKLLVRVCLAFVLRKPRVANA